jgi:hypothetical protein
MIQVVLEFYFGIVADPHVVVVDVSRNPIGRIGPIIAQFGA